MTAFEDLLGPDLPGVLPAPLPPPSEAERLVDELVARGSAQDLASASTLVGRRLVGPAARDLRRRSPEDFRRWTIIGERLGREADRVDDVGIARLLDSYGGKPRQLLAALAERDEPIVQGTLAGQLDWSDDYMSKVAARLEQADLLLRWRDGRRKTLYLTPGGRRIAATVAEVVPTPSPSLAWVTTSVTFELVVTSNTGAGRRAAALASGDRPAMRW